MRGAAERGFVLLGVVVFVLALTILGLSLFSLSSYEAQFLGQSLNQTKAFYAASGGLERAKCVLIATERLETVGQNLPLEGVTAAVATQVQGGVPNTSGPIQWGGNDIELQVTGSVQGGTRTVRAWFHPVAGQSHYRRLATAAEWIDVSSDPTRQTIEATGTLYQGQEGLAWQANLKPPPPDSIKTLAGIPVPPVEEIFALAPSPPLAIRTEVGGNPVYTLDALGLEPGYFSFNGPVFSLDEALGSTTIKVRGPAVWLLPRGIHIFNEITVETLGSGGPNTCLVIVAGANTNSDAYYHEKGIWFQQGILTPSGVPLIFVTNGRFILTQQSNTTDTGVGYLSIYARNVTLEGPIDPVRMTLVHGMNAPQDDSGGLLDWLASHGALPMGTATVDPQLTMIPGKWRESGN